jgi:hypothetical protein
MVAKRKTDEMSELKAFVCVTRIRAKILISPIPTRINAKKSKKELGITKACQLPTPRIIT